jgi:hypothetical protein
MPSRRSEKAQSAQAMHPPRKESGAAGCTTGLHPPSLKQHRAYSAPMIPKHHGHGTEDDDLQGHLGDPDDEIAGDEFFQRYHFPQTGQPDMEDASSSSADSSSDTEGPLSPTHVKIKTRYPGPADALSGPRSPAPSVAVSCIDWLPLQH